MCCLKGGEPPASFDMPSYRCEEPWGNPQRPRSGPRISDGRRRLSQGGFKPRRHPTRERVHDCVCPSLASAGRGPCVGGWMGPFRRGELASVCAGMGGGGDIPLIQGHAWYSGWPAKARY